MQDLHAITPADYLEIGDGVLHTLSWQMARHMNVPISGVYVANPGYMLGVAGIPRGAVLTELDGKPLKDLDDALAIFQTLGHGQRATARFFTMEDTRTPQLTSIRIDRAWFPARHCVRDDAIGIWPCTPIAAGPDAPPPKPGTTLFTRTGDKLVDEYAPSLVLVEFNMPYAISGVTERNYHGTGVVIDPVRGLVAVDRNTVPVALGDVRLTFAGTVQVDATVEYVHPLHNLAVVRYDPRQLGDTPVKAVKFAERMPATGETVHVVGLQGDNRVVSQQATVSSIGPVGFPLSRTLQFRDANLEIMRLVNGPADFDGVIVDKRGDVAALWSSFAYEADRELVQQNMGVPASLVQEMLEYARGERTLYSAEAEYGLLSLAEARQLGLDEDWIDRVTAHNPKRRTVLTVDRLVAGSPAAKLLEPGDLLLAVDGKVVNSFGDVSAAVRAPEVTLTIWRAGQGNDRAAQDRRALGPRRGPRADLGGRDAAGAASRDGRAARHRARRGLHRLLHVRLAGLALQALGRPAHHGSGRHPRGGSRRFHPGRHRAARRRVAAAQDRELERPGRDHHAQARPALLAGLRTAAHGDRLEAPAARVSPRLGAAMMRRCCRSPGRSRKRPPC